jgi:hypothetical protein
MSQSAQCTLISYVTKQLEERKHGLFPLSVSAEDITVQSYCYSRLAHNTAIFRLLFARTTCGTLEMNGTAEFNASDTARHMATV